MVGLVCLGLCTLEVVQVMVRSMLALSCVNMGLALYAGFFIPVEYHESFAFPIRDYFLISFVGFCLSLYRILKK